MAVSDTPVVNSPSTDVKVAHVTASDLSLRYLLLNQLTHLRRAGYQVDGVSAHGPDVPVIEAAGIRHVAVPMTRRFDPVTDLRALWALYRTFRRERYTVVHTHTPKGGLLGQYAALLAGVPVRVHTIHGLYFPGGATRARRRVFVLLERITMYFSHLNLSQNPEDVMVAVSEKICAPDRIELLGNGIDTTLFDPARYPAARRAEIRASLGLAPGHKVIGIVARFVAEKGYRELLRAAQVVRTVVPDVRFILVGGVEPAKQDALHPSIIDEMGLSDIVTFLGHRSDVADLYAAMDILALPSYREGFPRAPMEAASMGVPTVATDIRGCRQAVEDRVTGLLVPPRDADQLASALLELLQDDARRAAFAQAARAKALREFDERVVFARVQDAYARLLAARRRQTASVMAPRAE